MNQEKVGNFIADMRKEKGLTQAQLAERLGISNKTVSRWETGKNMPDYAILEDLTRELDITVNELIRGEKIIKAAIIQEYDHNLVEVLKEYKRMKRAKNIMLCLLLALAVVTSWLAIMLFLTLGLPSVLGSSAPIEINKDIAKYADYKLSTPRFSDAFGNPDICRADVIFPAQITEHMVVADYKAVYYNPWDPQYLSCLVVEYDENAWKQETERLKKYPSTEYTGYYGVSGFNGYELLAVCADEYYGFVYALGDSGSQRIIYVEILFCNYFLDLDYEDYIPAEYLPDEFDATPDNAYRRERLK